MGFSSRILVVAIVVAAFMVIGAETAWADSMTWELTFVDSSNGATYTGSFTGDAGGDGILTESEVTAWDLAYSGYTLGGFTFPAYSLSSTPHSGIHNGGIVHADTAGDELVDFRLDTALETVDTIIARSHDSTVVTTARPDEFRLVTNIGFGGAFQAIHGVYNINPTFTNPNGLPVSNATVPEPGTWALLGMGVLGLAYQRRRKLKAS